MPFIATIVFVRMSLGAWRAFHSPQQHRWPVAAWPPRKHPHPWTQQACPCLQETWDIFPWWLDQSREVASGGLEPSGFPPVILSTTELCIPAVFSDTSTQNHIFLTWPSELKITPHPTCAPSYVHRGWLTTGHSISLCFLPARSNLKSYFTKSLEICIFLPNLCITIWKRQHFAGNTELQDYRS